MTVIFRPTVQAQGKKKKKMNESEIERRKRGILMGGKQLF